jgi:hypothetical protein
MFTEFRLAVEGLAEWCFVLPAVEFVQDEHAKQGVHLVACRTLVTVVGFKSEVGYRKLTDELLNRVVIWIYEPDPRDDSNVRF